MSETHNGVCNHGSTGYCRTCSEESQDAIAELRRLRSRDWITREQDQGAEIAKLRAERDEARALLRKVPVGSEFRSDWGNWVKKRDAALNGEKNNGIS